jgi:hypothetical protein
VKLRTEINAGPVGAFEHLRAGRARRGGLATYACLAKLPSEGKTVAAFMFRLLYFCLRAVKRA